MPGVVNDGTQPLTIDRMRLEPMPDGLTALDTDAADGERKDSPATQVDWDEQRVFPRLNPAAGYTVMPGRRKRFPDTQLLFILRLTRPGTFKTERAVIEYHDADGKRYRRTLRNGFTVCTPVERESECKDKTGAQTPPCRRREQARRSSFASGSPTSRLGGRARDAVPLPDADEPAVPVRAGRAGTAPSRRRARHRAGPPAGG